MIYLDNNATTPLAPEALAVYRESMEVFGNASSVHQAGRRARALLQESRESLAQLLEVDEANLIFTSGGTEALNLAMLGVFLPDLKKRHLILSPVEHSAVLETARYLSRLGVEISFLQVDSQGRLDLSSLEELVRPETGLISVMWANNETGNLYPVDEIAEIARRYSIPFLCDAVQVLGKVKLDIKSKNIDFLSASSHKFHGPKGVGFLYLRSGTVWQAPLRGGRQERGRRPGTENIPAIAAMVAALKRAQQTQVEDQCRVTALRDRLQKGIFSTISGCHLHGDPERRVGNTLNLRIEGVAGESALIRLDMAGVAVSVGAACESGSLEPSHVLLAMGLEPRHAMDGLRFSLSRYNTEAEIDRTLEILPQVVRQIRGF